MGEEEETARETEKEQQMREENERAWSLESSGAI